MKKLLTLAFLGIFAIIASTSAFCFAQEDANCTFSSVKASHILVDTKAEAQAIKTKIDNGESFEAMAKLYSKCPSSSEGGNLGFFDRGQMVKPFEDAAFSLPVGKVSDPIKTQFGWHLIKVYETK